MKRDVFAIWGPGEEEDPRRIRLRYSLFGRLLCRVLKAKAVTLRRTVRTNLKDFVERPAVHLPLLRHEGTHVKQQDGNFLHWLWAYVFEKDFRAMQENQADAAEYAIYPVFRWKGLR